MIFQVSASYLFTEDGERQEMTIKILYECQTEQEAILAAIRWALNRAQANEWNKPACIKVDTYWIGKPEPSGYISSGSHGLGVFEWKYDTSPVSVEELLRHYSEKKEISHAG